MSFIGYIEYDDASEKLKKLYDSFGGRSKTPNIVRIAGTNPPAMNAHVDLYKAIMHQKSELTRHQREMIAVIVSSINKCHY